MKFDDILGEIGEFGSYQKLKYFLLCLTAMPGGFHSLMAIFITAIPAHGCSIPGYSGDTYALQNGNHTQALEARIPSAYNNDTCRIEYSKCNIFMNSSTEGMVEQECSSWVYDQTTFIDTVMTEFNLVCGDETFKALAQSIFMVWLLWGSILFGSVSDYFGRKKALMLSLLLAIVAGFATAFAPGIISFIALRMVIGAALMGTYMTAFVMGIEMVGPSKRLWTGSCLGIFWSLGAVAVCGIAYAFRNWSSLQIAITAPIVLLLIYWWLIPESPRWLLSKGRNAEAIVIIKEMARKNNKPMPDIKFQDDTEESQEGVAETVKFWQMFTSPVLLIRCMVLFWNWIVVTMVFYSISLNGGNLAGNIYMNTALNFSVQLPASFFCILLWDRLGRRKIQVGSMLVGGVACVCTAIPVLVGLSEDCEFSLRTVTLVLSLVGQMGASAAFSTIYIYSSELYPTVVRNSAMGMSSMLARIGGMVAPFVADLGLYVPGKIGQILPLVIFGVCSISAGLVALLLPETLNQKLPDTISDAKQFGRKVKNKMWIDSGTVHDVSDERGKDKYTYINPGFTDVSVKERF